MAKVLIGDYNKAAGIVEFDWAVRLTHSGRILLTLQGEEVYTLDYTAEAWDTLIDALEDVVVYGIDTKPKETKE